MLTLRCESDGRSVGQWYSGVHWTLMFCILRKGNSSKNAVGDQSVAAASLLFCFYVHCISLSLHVHGYVVLTAVGDRVLVCVSLSRIVGHR